MYSLLVSREQAKMTAKGIKKTFVKKHVKHHMFLKTLQNKSFTTAEYLSFRSRNHFIHTQRNFKICLSSYDDKRYLLADGINSLAYGHYSVTCDNRSCVDLWNDSCKLTVANRHLWNDSCKRICVYELTIVNVSKRKVTFAKYMLRVVVN